MVSAHPLDNLPHELSLLVQLATDDDRPTLIIDPVESQPLCVFKNLASERALAQVSPDALQEWIVNELVHECPAKATPTAYFADRQWIKKKLGTHVVIYCKHDFVHCLTEDSHPDSRLDSLVHDWIRFPDKVPVNDWIRYLLQYDWSNTAIGAISGPRMDQWPAPLRGVILSFMHCPRPRIIYWGHDLILFYNEPAAKLFGSGHPASLGNKQADSWGQDLWDHTAELIRASWEEGQSIYNQGRMLLLDRGGLLEEGYFDGFLLPFTGPDGRWICSVNCFTEITPWVMQRNRDDVSRKLLESFSQVTTLSNLWLDFLGILDEDADDVAFTLLYTAKEEGPTTGEQAYHLYGSSGLTSNAGLTEPSEGMIKAFRKAETGDTVVALKDATFLPELGITISDSGTVTSAFVFALFDMQGTTLGFVVVGVNPRRYANDEMKRFIYSLSEVLLKAVVIIQSPLEQRKLLQTDDSLSYRIQLEKLSRQLSVATLKNEKNQETFGRMAENAPIGMFLYQPDGTPIYLNDQFLELLGEKREEYFEKAKTGFAWRDCIHPDDEEFAKSAWVAAVESHHVITIEFRVKAGTKSSPTRARWLEGVVSPQRDSNGNLETIQGYLTDISARKLTEALTHERMNTAIETKRASENFIDMVSHEMRNPLSSILQLADVILATLPSTLSPEVHDALADAAHTINICALHQKTIIDEVLTVSKLDSNLLVLSPERTRPREVIDKALKMFEAELELADIQTHVEQLPNDCDVGEVMCDAGRLLQIMINLLTNAIKFSKNSETRRVTFTYGSLFEAPSAEDCAVEFVQRRKRDHEDPNTAAAMLSSLDSDDGADDVYLFFSVEDSGCGLDPEESQLLFQRFKQAPKTYKQYGGSGLGLFICRELVELQKGLIGLRSEAGVGSRFAFYIKAKRAMRVSRAGSIASVESSISVGNLPQMADSAFDAVKILEKIDMVEAPKTLVKDMHVLIVEDNEINRKVMSQQLRKLGCKVNVAENGLEALNHLSTTTYLSTTKGGTPLSLILLDIEMPIMDGLTCVRRIRQLEQSGGISGHIPVIAITANARSEQIATALESGMDSVVTKPFKIRDLVPQMEALVDKWAGFG